MPILTWVGKEKVVNHHHEVPFRVLKKEYSFASQPAKFTKNPINNRIIYGDNLEALKSLLPEFEGKIDCIYIDPPYNTGNEGWVYNDNVNDPKIKKWLGQVVGKEGEDLSRHDKWLCMMYPRLKLLHRLLADDGAIFISIDDIEQATLKLLMDEIFGLQNFIASIIWQKKQSPQSDAINLSGMHDYVIVYARKAKQNRQDEIGWSRNLLPRGDIQDARFENPDNDPRGEWTSTDYTCNKTADERPNLFYPITNPNTGEEIYPSRTRVWAYDQEAHKRNTTEGRLWWGANGKGKPRIKKYLAEVADGIVPTTWWAREFAGDNQESRRELRSIFVGDENAPDFSTPKPSSLIQRILQVATGKNSIVLDSFAGSGTTGHAVLKQNIQDGGNRRFILCEMMGYAETITAERVRRVINGYGEGDKAVAGTGGGFDFYTIGDPIFLPDDNLNEAVGLDAIRDYVAYSEGIPAADRTTQDNPYTPHLLGLNTDMAWLFNYEANSATLLDLDYLASIKFGDAKPANAIIYADRCLLEPSFMSKHGITFKKIPRDITKF